MMCPSGSRNPSSYICTEELKDTVDRRICITSGRVFWSVLAEPKVSGNPVENHYPRPFLWGRGCFYH